MNLNSEGDGNGNVNVGEKILQESRKKKKTFDNFMSHLEIKNE